MKPWMWPVLLAIAVSVVALCAPNGQRDSSDVLCVEPGGISCFGACMMRRCDWIDNAFVCDAEYFCTPCPWHEETSP